MPAESLQERKRQKARNAIIAAAYELFGERGFDDVTVTEIAERAEVGRTTFFRYFGDKQEVVFADDERTIAALVGTLRREAERRAPIGDSLADALGAIRAATREGLTGWTAAPERSAVHARLLRRHPELMARLLLKQQQEAAMIVDVLTEHGATPEAATLATQVSLACLYTAMRVADDPARLPEVVEESFARLAGLGGEASGSPSSGE
ncbi:TetR family transcriptional regulator [Nonomuraea phyllanthi]|uniref:TetR family transcriptional regulator n=1 Tax=Nonomuraea phyllanthi TaxID=2219224 RepID=A0A5C4WQQ0_9ACTN|nr:TetR family transcriptional regulator [Nonomuraea phyllanthi]KAB8195945.1 TetR family transcriptional regulator [Nonomuraea phyllanthi]